MKYKTAHRLTSLMKTKTQLERFNYEEVQKRNLHALRDAKILREEALTPPQQRPEDSGIMQHQQNEKHVTRLLQHAKLKKQYAESLTDTISERRSMVKKALQREIALKELTRKIEDQRRKYRNKQEEAQHELIRSLKSSRVII